MVKDQREMAVKFAALINVFTADQTKRFRVALDQLQAENEKLKERKNVAEKTATTLNKRLRKCKNVYRDVTYKHQQVLAKNKILQKKLEQALKGE